MHTSRPCLASLSLVAVALAATALGLSPARAAAPDDPAAGAPPSADRSLSPYLVVAGADRKLPLAETSAEINVAGVIAHVRVHQLFTNDGPEPIEAVYVFPASTRAAVHGMRMKIGARAVEAKIDRKAAAAAAYQRAKTEGKRASLLEQQRPNVFTMKVANVMPGDRIAVDLDYSEMLIPESGTYELVYPGVVGPRYAGGADPAKDKWMATPYLAQGQAETYRFDVRVHLETGIAIQELSSPSHEIDVLHPSASSADVRLKRPGGGNRDYILRYRLAGDRIASGVLLAPPDATTGEGFFALMMEPPRRTVAEDAPPREYIFLVDVSGSMHGFPLDTAKAVAGKLFEGLRPQDAFNVVLFSGAFRVLAADGSLPATPANVNAALRLLGGEQGGGGTELMGGLRAAYGIPAAQGARSRTVVVITDGYVGVEAEAFRFIRERLDQANLFAFGIGSGVNRALIEGMARAGSGEPFVVTRPDQAPATAERFRRTIERPLLTRISVAFDGFDAYDQAPAKLPDLMAERPLVLFGKYRGEPRGRIEVRGIGGRGAFSQSVAITPGQVRREVSSLRWLWARKQVEWLEDELSLGASTADAIAELGLRYSLLTSQTSFVAVDQVVANPGGRQGTAEQPLPLPAGVSNLAVGASVELSRTEMPPGDPVLSVNASPDARLVTAYFPFGLVKDLRYDPFRERWSTRFLVPKGVGDGLYTVPVRITYRDGRTEVVAASYRIDSASPDFDVTVEPAPGGVTLRVVAAEPARKVTVALAGRPRTRVQLADSGDHVTFTGFVALPRGNHQLRVVVADQARNEGDDLIACEVP